MLVDCKKIICLELLFILFSIIISNAQNTGGIKGYIIDYSNKKPIKNVNIVLMPGNYASTTDTNGYYFISNIPLGTYTMNISHISYEKIEYSIQILVNKFIEQNFELKAITKVLSPVIVEGMSYNKEPYVINKLEMKQIEEIPIRDIGDYLRSVPNVAAVRKGGIHLDPVVRGLKFSQLNIQLDHGMKIEGGCPNRMDPTASHIEPEDVQNIEVLKGPFALKYGPSLGGVVNINTYKPVPYDTFQIKVKALRGYESNWNGHREYINIDGGNKKVYFNVSGTRKNYGNYEDGNGNKIFSSFHKYSFKSQLGIEPIKNHFFNLSYGEYHARDVRYPALPMDEREDNTKLMSLDYKGIQLTNWFKEINIKIYQSEVEHIM
ncbi:MAG TPA: carboxypeptidase-like regulatory domain-containing protein, partial [Bacteroidales bacterium]|nr:carboxypeptidase-like regulatory domain-containing protein [Bacteroidales bacterium]